MSSIKIWMCSIILLFAQTTWAQISPSETAVPMLVNFSGTLTDAAGKPLTATTSVTFSLYQNQQGGVPLWTETQSVQPNSSGWYTVMLGSTSQGLPVGLFVSGEPRWLEVQPQGQPIQPRITLLSVPYALKAGDAQTIGGLPPSAFMLAAPNSASSPTASTQSTSITPSGAPPSSSDVTTTGGTVNVLPLWTTATNIQSSVIAQTGSGTTAKIGIGTTAPAATLDIKGSSIVRGTLNLPATGTATATAGKDSQPQTLVASVFNSSTAKAVPQTFQWQAEPVSNDTSSASGSLNLLYGAGTSKPAETGLFIQSNGQITFATGQTFPGTGTGNGTVTSVGSGAGLTGGPITSTGSLSIANAGVTNAMLANSALTVSPGTALTGGGSVALGGSTTLNVDTTKVPLLAASNTFTGNQTTIGNLTATGIVTASAYDIAGTQIVSILPGEFNLYVGQSAGQGAGANNTGSSNTSAGYQTLFSNTSGSQNVAVGADALYSNTTGTQNTGIGQQALTSNTTGSQNTALGANAMRFNTTGGGNMATGLNALVSNTTGGNNTGSGDGALFANTSGSNNTASGFLALSANSTGINNTAFGYNTGKPVDGTALTGASNLFLGYGAAPSTGSLSNAGAIGVLAEVSQSDSIVLGGIAGVNGATVSQNVGIGTTAPISTLEVDSNVKAPTLGPTITMTNTAGSGQISLDFNTYPPSNTGIYNPASRIQIGDQGNFSDVIAFLANTPGAPNNGLVTTMSIDPYGDVHVNGTLSKGGGSFKIDHPLDPANKYLYHSFVESPDMMNVYNGNITTNKRGLAVVVLPEYFEALNRDFRYQLTVIGQFAQAIVAKEISHNHFTIRTNQPGVKVSWQVTGIRHDAFADAHRIPTEEEKPTQERGKYLHPELFGASEEQAIGYRPSSLPGTAGSGPQQASTPGHRAQF